MGSLFFVTFFPGNFSVGFFVTFFPWTLSRCIVRVSLGCGFFGELYRWAFLSCAIVQGLLSAPFFAKLPRHPLSQSFYRATFLGDIFRDFLGIDKLHGFFSGVYFRAIIPGAVFPRFLSQRICTLPHPRELFECVFFPHAVSPGFSLWTLSLRYIA